MRNLREKKWRVFTALHYYCTVVVARVSSVRAIKRPGIHLELKLRGMCQQQISTIAAVSGAVGVATPGGQAAFAFFFFFILRRMDGEK